MADDDLDFLQATEAKQADKSSYDPDIARTFFLNHGKPATLRKDGVLFSEQTPGDRMYFVLRGELALTINGKSLDVVREGEIVGEMSIISGAPRTATAVARADTMLISMEGSAFKEALVNQPEFAAMLMHMMLSRMRLTLSVLKIRGKLATAAANMSGCVLNGTLLGNVASALGDRAVVKFPKGRTIIVEGSSGVSMYAILEGKVAIAIQGKQVETAGPGGVFGEMALIDAGPRAASVLATADCRLLSLNKESFMALVRNNPAFGIGILRGFADRLRYLNTLRA
jgi:CRP-like cAMP-binding protein